MHSIYVLLSQLAPKVCKIEMYMISVKTSSSERNRSQAIRSTSHEGWNRYEHSSFSTHQYVLKGIRIHRRGISEPELNKYLEKVGFCRVRVRMQCVVR
jgi:hypothetical protein